MILRLNRRLQEGHLAENLPSLFFASTKNAAIDRLRSQHAKPTVGLTVAEDHVDPSAAPGESAEERESAARLREALARMRPRYRRALVLRHGLGLTVAEVAEQMELSLPAAKKLAIRATEQARNKLVAIESGQFCEEMQGAVRALIDRDLAGTASLAERQQLAAHLEHCGRCRSYRANLQQSLHQLGGFALLGGLGERSGTAAHLGHWLGQLAQAPQLGAEKLRLAAFRASGALQLGDAGSAGALAGTAQKVVAICGAAGATTATCLATGVIGPGLGASAATQHAASAKPPAPIFKEAAEPSAAEAPSPAEPSAAEPAAPSAKTESQPEPQGAPAASEEPSAPQEASEEFGFESSAPPAEAAPPPAPAPPAPVTSSGGRGGAGSGGESFGFGG